MKSQISSTHHGDAVALCHVISFVLILVVLFCIPSFASLFEGDNPEWQHGETSRTRRNAWPFLKDPDSLLSIQTMIRCVLIVEVLWPSLCRARRSSLGCQGRVLANTAVLLFFAAYMTRVALFQFSLMRLAGPIGGAVALVMDTVVLALLGMLASTCLVGCRLTEALVSFLVSSVLLTVAGWVACGNFLEVDPGAGFLGNVAFSCVLFTETAGCLAVFGALAVRLGPPPSLLLGLLGVCQQALGLYYFLDTFDKTPQSTPLVRWWRELFAADAWTARGALHCGGGAAVRRGLCGGRGRCHEVGRRRVR